MDQVTVESLRGKRVLVGVTYLEADGLTNNGHRQFLGIVQRVEDGGIVVQRTDTGAAFTLPAGEALLKRAVAGRYRLRRTGEVVVDPDYLCSLRVTGHPADDTSARRSQVA